MRNISVSYTYPGRALLRHWAGGKVFDWFRGKLRKFSKNDWSYEGFELVFDDLQRRQYVRIIVREKMMADLVQRYLELVKAREGCDAAKEQR